MVVKYKTVEFDINLRRKQPLDEFLNHQCQDGYRLSESFKADTISNVRIFIFEKQF